MPEVEQPSPTEILVEAIAYQTIMSLRMYDCLMALLRATDPVAAKNLLQIHKDGQTLSPAPRLEQDAFDD